MFECETRSRHAGSLADDPDLSVRGRDDRVIVPVEIEVAPAGEFGEWIACARATGGQWHGRQEFEGLRREHDQSRAFKADAYGHQPAGAVDRQRGAVGALKG